MNAQLLTEVEFQKLNLILWIRYLKHLGKLLLQLWEGISYLHIIAPNFYGTFWTLTITFRKSDHVVYVPWIQPEKE